MKGYCSSTMPETMKWEAGTSVMVSQNTHVYDEGVIAKAEELKERRGSRTATRVG